jgi:hypothetical protein
MLKIMQCFSYFLYNKNVFPFMQIHIFQVNLMKTQIIWKFQNLEIFKKKVAKEQTFL